MTSIYNIMKNVHFVINFYSESEENMKGIDTEKEFQTAFWKCYEKEPLEKISVGKLCQSAGYNRSTFYNHFTDIYELREKCVDEMLEPVKAKIMDIEDIKMLFYGNAVELMISGNFLKNNKHIETLFKWHDEYILGDRIKNNLMMCVITHHKETISDIEKLEIILDYQLSGALGVIRNWYNKGKHSEGDMLKEIFEIASKGFFNALREILE